MKTLHQIDFPAQMIILFASAVSMLIEPGMFVMGFLFGIGGWQALMALIFAFDDPQHRDSGRLMYERTLLGVIGAGIISAIIPNLFMVYAIIMVFLGFILGIWNMTIAYREYQLAKSNHQVWDID